MNDTISVYVETCQNYQNKQNIFRMRKDSNLREDYSVKEDTDSKYSKRQKTPHNYIIKFQSASQLAIGIQNLKEPQSIMVMDLSNSRIQNLSDQIMCLTSLQILNLSNNLLIEVPNCLYKLQLTSLSINNNLLKSLQISPYWFEKMEKLDVGKNHIRLLPLDLYSFTKLAYLDVRSNDFTDLHHQISKLEPTLQILGLDWVKYSFDKYFKERRDLLMDDDLLKFWDVVKAIFKQQKDDDMFSCRDFLQHQQWFNYDLPESISAQLPNQTCIQRPSQFRSSTDLDQSVMTNTAVSLYRNQIELPASLLHQSVKNEDLGMLRTLIAHDFGMTNIVDEDNHSAFSLAIAEEKYHCAKIFINAQVNPNIGGGSFQSVLSLAVSKMQFYLVRDILNQKIFVHKTDKRGNGPFHYLIPLFKKNIQEATKIGFLLYENGCDPNMRNNSGVTPLHLAIKKSFFSAVKFALQCNEKYGQKVFNFKLLSSKQNSVMHLAAKSENIKIILELFPMFPHLLFTYNCDGQRPFEIIQKNYTLSKLIQNLELVYIQKKIKTIPQQQIIKVERSTTQQLSRQGSWNLEQSEEESIKVALKLTQLQPKFKTNKNTILKAKDQNKIRSDKISSEDVQPIIINKSIQQDRNDIKQIELQNNMSKHRGKNMNKQIHKLLKEIEQSFSEYQANKQESLQQILFYQLKQVEVLKKDPVMNLHLENAQKLQKFNLNDIKINKIKTELDEYEYLQE